MSKKSKKLESVVLYERFMHVVALADGERPRVQAVSEDGQLVTAQCNETIYRRVLGVRLDEQSHRFHLGLRQMTKVKFRAHLDGDGVIQALDIIPNRMFVSGAAPRLSGENTRKGFTIHIDEELDGFDVWTEDPRDGEKYRVAYAGLSERELCDLLDALRAANWGSKKTLTLLDHKFEKVEEGVIRCRPIKEVKYTT